MLKLFKKVYRYTNAFLLGKFEEHADPKVQLQQAIADARLQQRKLKEQAGSVIENHKRTEMRLNKVIAEIAKVNGSTQQAVIMAQEAKTPQDKAKYEQAAESFANRLIMLEHEVESLKSLHEQSAKAVEGAKQAIAQNSRQMQRKLAEHQSLLSKLDQAKMAEQLNAATASLQASIGTGATPTLDEVRNKIEARYAKAQGVQELQSETVEAHVLEIETKSMESEATKRLSEIKAKMGIPAETGEDEQQQTATAEG